MASTAPTNQGTHEVSPAFLTPREASKALKVSMSTVRVYIRKLHLFDNRFLAADIEAQESLVIKPGDTVVVGSTQFGAVGLSICYDLRFPELFRSLAQGGATMVALPSAFRLHAGRDHWEVLVRARGI
jgi:predicted amidohydrolase